MKRWLSWVALIGLLVLGSPAGNVWAEIVMKVLIVNPSETETKEFTIHSALPPEVKAGDVLDPDGLSVESPRSMALFNPGKREVLMATEARLDRAVLA